MRKTKLRLRKGRKLWFQHHPWIPKKYYNNTVVEEGMIGALGNTSVWRGFPLPILKCPPAVVMVNCQA